MDDERTCTDRERGYVWHVHTNGRSHAFRVYPSGPVRLSVCGSVVLDEDPTDAPLTYPCCNCIRWTYTDRTTGKPRQV